jgi:hypothetical protein
LVSRFVGTSNPVGERIRYQHETLGASPNLTLRKSASIIAAGLRFRHSALRIWRRSIRFG